MKARIALIALVASCIACIGAGRRHLLLSGKAPAGAAAPTEVTDISGLFAWYRADLLVTNTSGTSPPTGGDLVKAWGDSSGNQRHLTTNNPTASAPSFAATNTTTKQIGGIEVTTGEYLRVGFTAIANSTMFAVWRVAALGSIQVVIDGTNSSGRQALYKRSSDAFSAYSGTAEISGGAAALNTWYIQAVTYNSSGNDAVYTNNVSITSGASGSQSLDGITLGADQAGGFSPPGNGFIGEVVIYNRVLNSTEIGQVFGILNGRWSIY